MKIQIDKLDAAPPHALTSADIRAVFAVIPEEWKGHLNIGTVRLSATSPDASRFDRPVIYSAYSRRLTICSRGLRREQAQREVLRELAILGLRVRTRMSHRVSEHELQTLDNVIAPLLRRLQAESVADGLTSAAADGPPVRG